VSGSVVPVPVGPFDVYLHRAAGTGGMATVWSARHRSTTTPVAVKVLHDAQALDDTFLEAFASEVRAVAGLDHPGVVHVLDHGRISASVAEASGDRLAEGSPYLVMEYASGGTLLSVPPEDAQALIDVLGAVLEALAHAHARGVVHRDIKAGNVLLCGPDDVRPGWKLSDFGLAVAVGDDPASGAFGQGVVGTPSYMAPEQFRGDVRDIGPWTDLYALGCLGWRLITGRTPFGGGDSGRLAKAHASRPLPPFAPRFEVPAGLEAWLRRMLRKAPHQRFAGAADARRALASLEGGAAPARPAEIAPEDAPTELLSGPLLPASGPALAATGGAPTEIPELPPEGPRAAAPSLLGAGLGLLRVRRLPLVGRDEHRSKLWAALRRVFRERRPGVALVHGERGRGKTRLLAWLTEQASESGVARVFWVRHGPTGSLADGLAGTLARTFGLAGLGVERRRDRIRARLAAQGVSDPLETAAILAMVGDDAGRRGPSPEEQRAVFTRFLAREAADRPVVLAVDDLHRGEAALELGRDLAREGRREVPLLVVGACTAEALRADDPVGVALRALLEAGATSVEVEPLGDDEVDRLLAALLGLSTELAADVRRRAEGNPLFAVQMVGDLADRGALEAGPLGFRRGGGGPAALPSDIHALWEARLDRLCAGLPSGSRGALEIAAVLGEHVRSAEWRRACVVAGRPADGLEEALLSAGLAYTDEDGWRFAHGLLRESIVATARGAGRLSAHHRACADMLAQRPGRPSGSDLERRGLHLLGAEDLDAAISPLLDAAERLWKGEASRSAARVLDRVDEALRGLGAAPGDPRSLQAAAVRGMVLLEIGDVVQAGPVAEDLLVRARASGAVEPEGRALLVLARLHLRGYRSERGLELIEEALPRLEGAADKTRAELFRMQARALAHLQRYDEAVAAADRALRIAEASDDDSDAGRAYAVHAFIHRQLGDHGRAEERVLLANERYERAGHLSLMADGFASLGESHRASGRHTTSLQWFARAEELWARTGNRHELMAILCRAGVLIEMGRYEEALGHIERARVRLDPTPGYLTGAASIIELQARSELREWPIVAVVVDELVRLERHELLANPDYLEVLDRAAELAREDGQEDTAALLERLSARLQDARSR